MTDTRDWLRRLFSAFEADRPRQADMDGIVHHASDECTCRPRHCRACGGRLHAQGVYAGMMYLCEGCDSGEWQPAGILDTDGPLVEQRDW